MCVFSAAQPPKKHTLVLFEAAGGGGLKKNILFRTRYLAATNTQALFVFFYNSQKASLSAGCIHDPVKLLIIPSIPMTRKT